MVVRGGLRLITGERKSSWVGRTEAGMMRASSDHSSPWLVWWNSQSAEPPRNLQRWKMEEIAAQFLDRAQQRSNVLVTANGVGDGGAVQFHALQPSPPRGQHDISGAKRI